MWSGDKRVSSNHHSFAGFGVNRLVTARVYYILLVSAISFYYLSIISMSVYKQVLLLIYLQCDGELSRFFLLHDVKNNAIFVFLFLLLFQNESWLWTWLAHSRCTNHFSHENFFIRNSFRNGDKSIWKMDDSCFTFGEWRFSLLDRKFWVHEVRNVSWTL